MKGPATLITRDRWCLLVVLYLRAELEIGGFPGGEGQSLCAVFSRGSCRVLRPLPAAPDCSDWPADAARNVAILPQRPLEGARHSLLVGRRRGEGGVVVGIVGCGGAFDNILAALDRGSMHVRPEAPPATSLATREACNSVEG